MGSLPEHCKEEDLTVFPDGYAVGTSNQGDIVLLSFLANIAEKNYVIKSFALTPRRAADLVKALNAAIERTHQQSDKKEKKTAEKPS